MMKRLIDTLTATGCSLVVESRGEVSTYNKKGRLHGAHVADKLVGKASAALLVRGGVSEVYALVMSRLATPLLDQAGIAYDYGELVDRIVIPQGDTRCPLEQIVAPAQTAAEAEHLLREHFEAMQNS